MTKAEVKREFDECFPRETFMVVYGGPTGKKQLDTIARDETWNNYTDSLCTDGRITTHQYETWTNPWGD